MTAVELCVQGYADFGCIQIVSYCNLVFDYLGRSVVYLLHQAYLKSGEHIKSRLLIQIWAKEIGMSNVIPASKYSPNE